MTSPRNWLLSVSLTCLVATTFSVGSAFARPPRVPSWCHPSAGCRCHEICTYDGRTTKCRFICSSGGGGLTTAAHKSQPHASVSGTHSGQIPVGESNERHGGLKQRGRRH